MPICADVEITDDISCGICVPCEQDSDCQPIDVDPLIGDLFVNEPLAQIAFALLADLLWGDNPDHHLNFFCLDVAAGYGACIPCANPLSPCGQGGGGMGSGMCNHDVCSTGDALDGNCDPCAAAVCAQDDFCCTNTWDSICVDLADSECNDICTGGDPCTQDFCQESGAALEGCNACTQAVCAQDPYCCDVAWDQYCVAYTDPQDPEYISACSGLGC
jgi:hypothetical protein